MSKRTVNVNMWPVDMEYDATDDDDAIDQARDDLIEWARDLGRDDFTVEIKL